MRQSSGLRKYAAHLGAVLALSAMTAVQAVAPGEYIPEGGWGILTIGKPSHHGAPFTLDTKGSNGHMCNFRGLIERDAATVSSGADHTTDCKLDFHSSDTGISVKADTHETCERFCGTRAGFEGAYFKPREGCTPARRRTTRSAYLAAYSAERYKVAISVLAPQLSRCSKSLSGVESAGIRNDLAVAYFHAGDVGMCLNVLEPLLTQASKDQLALLSQVAPSDAEVWSAIDAKATHNKALCSEPTK